MFTGIYGFIFCDPKVINSSAVFGNALPESASHTLPITNVAIETYERDAVWSLGVKYTKSDNTSNWLYFPSTRTNSNSNMLAIPEISANSNDKFIYFRTTATSSYKGLTTDSFVRDSYTYSVANQAITNHYKDFYIQISSITNFPNTSKYKILILVSEVAGDPRIQSQYVNMTSDYTKLYFNLTSLTSSYTTSSTASVRIKWIAMRELP